ncbi:MAG: TonB-dependent receptor, partial [Flavobacterium sp.]
MHKILTLVLFLACTSFAFGQTVSIKGKVTGPDDFPLESATIYLTSVKDSSVVDYTISNKNGNWEIKVRKISEPVFLKISFMGFSDYRKQLESVTENIDLGTLKMEDQPTELDEIVIKSEIPPIRIKSDTLEFNASSFKVRPDANVEALLKQLPGVEVDNEGKITVNGKEVNQILVNGKPFFDKDGKIALQNLPAEIIDKVQVTDTKTKTEELSGQKAAGNEASINLTIQEDKNKGQFGKFMAGYGSDKRYESSALFNTFKGKRKISVLASSNNINSTGFSMDEIFDNMGGGRNMSVFTTSGGGFGINGMQFGGGQGITQSNMVGLNYSDQWFKDFDNTLSYFYTSSDSNNENRTKEQNFLPQEEDIANPGTFINNNFTTESSSKTNSYRYAHTMNTEFEWKIDSTSALQFSPKFVTSDNKIRSTSRQFSVDENNELLNENDATTFNENKSTSFSNNMYYNKALKRKGRSIGAWFNNENRKDDGTFLNRSTTLFYEDTDNNGITDVRDDI